MRNAAHRDRRDYRNHLQNDELMDYALPASNCFPRPLVYSVTSACFRPRNEKQTSCRICAVLTRHAAGDICGYNTELRGSSAMYSGRNIMRRWCATLTLGALLALPLFAQQKDATSDNNNGTTDTTAAPTPAPSDFNIAPASRNMFAMPA